MTQVRLGHYRLHLEHALCVSVFPTIFDSICADEKTPLYLTLAQSIIVG